MTIEAKQLAHVCIFASDLAETRDFYRDVLGLEVKFNFTRQGEWYGFYLDAGGRSNIEVFLKPEAAFDERNRINHLCLEVASIDDAVAPRPEQGDRRNRQEARDRRHLAGVAGRPERGEDRALRIHRQERPVHRRGPRRRLVTPLSLVAAMAYTAGQSRL